MLSNVYSHTLKCLVPYDFKHLAMFTATRSSTWCRATASTWQRLQPHSQALGAARLQALSNVCSHTLKHLVPCDGEHLATFTATLKHLVPYDVK